MTVITKQEFRRLKEANSVGFSDSVIVLRDNLVVRTNMSSLVNLVFRTGAPLRLVTGNYSVVNSDVRIEVKNTAPALIILPDPALHARRELKIINHYNSTSVVSFSRSINSDSSFTLLNGESIDIYSNITEWMVD